MQFLSVLVVPVLLIAGLAPLSPPAVQNSTLEIKITDIRNTKGNFVLGFYKDNKSFAKRQPFMRKQVEKSSLNNGILTYHLTLPNGTYGIALLDDENKNGKIDYGFLLPVEGFGFSDYFHRGLTAPSFDAFDFRLTSSNKTVFIKMKYM